MMANQGSSTEGWRCKGTKQLRVREVEKACTLSKALESQGIKHSIEIICDHDFEMVRAREAWAGLELQDGNLVYKGVRIRKD